MLRFSQVHACTLHCLNDTRTVHTYIRVIYAHNMYSRRMYDELRDIHGTAEIYNIIIKSYLTILLLVHIIISTSCLYVWFVIMYNDKHYIYDKYRLSLGHAYIRYYCNYNVWRAPRAYIISYYCNDGTAIIVICNNNNNNSIYMYDCNNCDGVYPPDDKIQYA